MRRSPLYSPNVITLILILQFIPLVLFPPRFFSPSSQVWWLPVLLAVMVLTADFQIIVRRSTAASPWHLIAFAQGLNIISRLMMLWPNASTVSEAGTSANLPYLILTFVAMGLSAFMLWYSEQPQARIGLLHA